MPREVGGCAHGPSPYSNSDLPATGSRCRGLVLRAAIPPPNLLLARARLFAQSRSPRSLPEGKTLQDVLSGQWPGDETDEEVYEALRKLS
jgi:hypothetical protein